MAHPFADHPPSELPIRVLRILTRPNLGGPTRQAIALWHAHRELAVPTLLVTGAVGPDEVMLAPCDHGVPQRTLAEVLAAGKSASGWLPLPELHRGVDPLADWRAKRALRAVIRSLRPHVVHTHTSKAGWLGRRAAFGERVPVTAHTFHGHVLQDYFARLPTMLLRRLERKLARCTDCLFSVSASCADELAAAGVAPRARLIVVPPAVAEVLLVARDVARKRLSIAPGDRRVAAIGRLVPIKRLGDFVQAIATSQGLTGDIIGDGPERDRLQALAERSAPGRIRLLGAEPSIASLLPAYDAVVLPSVREGCPLVAIEAFAAGVPVVGYDVPGVRDALRDFGRGVLVPPAGGPAALARAIEALLADAMGCAMLVCSARRAVATSAPAAVATTLLAIYRQVAATSPRMRYHRDGAG